MTGSTAERPAQVPPDRLGDAALLAGDGHLQLVVGRRVVATVAGVGDDAGEARAELGLDLRDHGRERVAVIRGARQRLEAGDELATFEWASVVATDTLTPNS